MNINQKPQILIVDDERTQRKTLRDIFADHGYQTLTAKSGKVASEIMTGSPVSLALIDLRLGDESGLEVLNRIKKVRPDVECIVITAHASQKSAIEALNQGAFSYLQKPIDAERLLIAAERALEKRASERELRRLKAFHEGVVHSMSEGIAVEDEQGRFTFLNPAACKMLGYSRDELLGKNRNAVIPADQRDLIRKADQSREEGRSTRYEVQVERKNGERLHVLVSGSPRFENGEFVGTLAVFTDITDRVQKEKRLGLQGAALESAVNAILITDDDGTIEWVNHACTSLTGYAKEDLIGRNPHILKSGYQEPEFYAEMWETITAGDPWRGQLINRRKDGTSYIEEQTITPVKDDQGKVAHYIAIKQDVTNQARAKYALKRQLKELRLVNALAGFSTQSNSEDELISHAVQILGDGPYPDHVGVLLLDDERGVLVAHPSYHGLAMEENSFTVQIGQGIPGRVAQSGQPVLVSDITEEPVHIGANPRMRSELCVPIKTDDRVLGVINAEDARENAFDQADQRLLTTFAGQLATAIERGRLLESARNRASELSALYQSALAITRELDPNVMVTHLGSRVEELFHPDAFLVATLEPENDTIQIDMAVERGQRLPEVEGHILSIDEERGLINWMMRERTPLLVEDMATEALPVEPHRAGEIPRSWLGVPMVGGERLVGAISLQSFKPRAFDENDQRLLGLFANQAAVALENARLFSATEKQAASMSLVNDVARKAIEKVDTDELPWKVAESVQTIFGYPDVLIFLVDEKNQRLKRVAWAGIYERDIEENPFKPLDGDGVLDWVVTHGETALLNDVRRDERYMEHFPETNSEICVPMVEGDQVVGGINVESDRTNAFDETDVMALETLADSLVAGLRAARLFEEVQDRVEQLEALRRIDRTISSSLDINLTLNVLLAEVRNKLGIDAADVLLYNPGFQQLEYTAASGYKTQGIEGITLQLGEGFAGRAVSRRELVHFPDLSELDPNTTQPLSFVKVEGFRGYAAMPLVAKGKVKGVLEVYQRSSLYPDPNWFDFLEALAMEAAIAVDHMGLFEELQQSNVGLTQAYEKTLEGWAKALELRDHETQGHSDRVTKLTLRLAGMVGVDEGRWKYIKWGALLHDIGKMAIPDHILQKSGDLSEEEWRIMRKHPGFACEMLSSIDHLKPALDIPRYHHERWDGGGYPEGLEGEEIPLPARIFAVVDVWDALRSDRPYRDAWSDKKALEHIQAQSGKHFDPQVVEAFMDIIQKEHA